MRTRQKRFATDTWRSLGYRTTPLEHWSKRKPTVEPQWVQTGLSLTWSKTLKTVFFVTRLFLFLEERGVEEEEYGGVIERRRKFIDHQAPPPRMYHVLF